VFSAVPSVLSCTLEPLLLVVTAWEGTCTTLSTLRW
jgi:hypothetical protein